MTFAAVDSLFTQALLIGACSGFVLGFIFAKAY